MQKTIEKIDFEAHIKGIRKALSDLKKDKANLTKEDKKELKEIAEIAQSIKDDIQ